MGESCHHNCLTHSGRKLSSQLPHTQWEKAVITTASHTVGESCHHNCLTHSGRKLSSQLPHTQWEKGNEEIEKYLLNPLSHSVLYMYIWALYCIMCTAYLCIIYMYLYMYTCSIFTVCKEIPLIPCRACSSISVEYNMYLLMRGEERWKKEASKVKQTTRQSNTTHPRQSLFQRKMSCLGWDSNPRHSRQSALLTELPHVVCINTYYDI